MAALPPKYTMTIWRDATFQKALTYYTGATTASTPYDLTGCSVTMTVKTPGLQNTLLTLSSTTGEIALGDTNGVIAITIPASVTATLPWASGIYELLLTNGSVVTPLLWGVIRVKGI